MVEIRWCRFGVGGEKLSLMDRLTLSASSFLCTLAWPPWTLDSSGPRLKTCACLRSLCVLLPIPLYQVLYIPPPTLRPCGIRYTHVLSLLHTPSVTKLQRFCIALSRQSF